MLMSPSPNSLGIHLGLWGLAQSNIRVEDCVGFCICLSWGCSHALERPRTDSAVPGAAQSSQQTGPALHSSPSRGVGLATHSRRETWSSQWETTACLKQPVCWHWGWWRAEHGRFPKMRSWNGKGGKTKWEGEAGKDVCSKKTVMQLGGSSPLAQIDNPVKTL